MDPFLLVTPLLFSTSSSPSSIYEVQIISKFLHPLFTVHLVGNDQLDLSTILVVLILWILSFIVYSYHLSYTNFVFQINGEHSEGQINFLYSKSFSLPRNVT